MSPIDKYLIEKGLIGAIEVEGQIFYVVTEKGARFVGLTGTGAKDTGPPYIA